MKRYVTQTGKDSDGDITALCNPSSYWRKVSKNQAIHEIDNRINQYAVSVHGREVEVIVRRHSQTGMKYLTTSPDGYSPNNLDDLPNCTC